MLKRVASYGSGMQPTQVMVIGFATVILVGAIILNLPISTQNGESIGFLNALFTATSAVCVTGLVVVDTSTYWSFFGQLTIIMLIQIGGLGFMTVTTMFALITGKRINLKERLLIQEALNQRDLSGIVRLTRYVLMMTFTIEGIGALILSTKFIPMFGFVKGTWFSIFHAISAFCNAGFDLMGATAGKFTSIVCFNNSYLVMLTISALIILGGIGFPVLLNIIREKRYSRYNLHTKVVIFTTISLIIVGTITILAIEFDRPSTLGDMPLPQKIVNAYFQSVTSRTAGFASIDLTKLRESTLFAMIILMFIGAAPASTGGGIKVTTLATLLLSVKSLILGKSDIEIYERRISSSTVRKAMVIFVVGISFVVIGTFLLSATQEQFTLTAAAFEVASAFATVGLSIGGSPTLTPIGKLLIIMYMFAGRVGSLTIFMAFMSGGSKKVQPVRYPEGSLIVG